MASVALTVREQFGINYSQAFVRGIDTGLLIKPAERPQSIVEFERLLDLETPLDIARFDWRAELGTNWEPTSSSSTPAGEFLPSTATDAVKSGLNSGSIELLTAVEIGRRLGISDEAVHKRELAGELFSMVRSRRGRGPEYPAFQSESEIAGVLSQILERLEVSGRAAGAFAYGFFVSPSDLLNGLTPIEVLRGRVSAGRRIDEDGTAGALLLLGASTSERAEAAMQAADAHLAAAASS
jgi:hypothetical protein